MWRRVLLVLVAYSAIVVVGLAVPLALTIGRERLQRFGESRIAAASYFSDLAARQHSGDLELQEAVTRYHALYGEGVVVVDRNGDPRASAGLGVDSPAVQNAVSGALRNQRSGVPSTLTPWSHSDVMIAVPVGAGTQVDGAVVLSVSTAAAARDVARAWSVIALGAVGLLAAASVIAVALSRWTVRPLTALSVRVNTLSAAMLDQLPMTVADTAADGSPDGIRAGSAGPPEVRELARVFDAMAGNVEAAAAAQRRLVADSAHALRNPLAALRIRLDTLGIGLSGKAAEAHRKTTTEVDRLSDVVADLLTLATAESRPAQPPDASCVVEDVLAARYEFWSSALADAQMTATVVAASGGVAAIPEDDLNQILDVLLSNTVKYAGAGSHVEICCQARENGMAVWVADSGRGVSDEDLPLLVNRFFRASSTVGQGTGLGLAIARALTERAGGVLTVGASRPAGLRVQLALPSPS
ncbi:MAG: HAMP domain-containing histidine kinase [Actinobacteria bacterium]|nr:HAMP domain-containing histidine kinase [Actinomycetota bacterium]